MPTKLRPIEDLIANLLEQQPRHKECAPEGGKIEAKPAPRTDTRPLASEAFHYDQDV